MRAKQISDYSHLSSGLSIQVVENGWIVSYDREEQVSVTQLEPSVTPTTKVKLTGTTPTKDPFEFAGDLELVNEYPRMASLHPLVRRVSAQRVFSFDEKAQLLAFVGEILPSRPA